MNPKKSFQSIWFKAVLYFAFMILVGYHGFSIGYWGELVDQNKQIQFLGQNQGVRSDDFFVGLPLAFSQIKNDFSATNQLLGYGQSNLVTSYSIPVKHWMVFFKPLTWGYFAGPKWGLSWHWNLNVILTFLAVFLFLKTFTLFKDKTISFLSIAFLLSSFFQFWSYIGAPYFYWPIFMVLIINTAEKLQSAVKLFLAMLILTWVLSCFAFTIYPPFQIVGVYFISLFSFFFIYLSKNRKKLFIFLIPPALLVGALIYIWFRENKDIIEIIGSTVYPGRRFTSGGQGSLLNFLQSNIFSIDALRAEPRFGGNVSEGSGFWNLFIPMGLLISINRKKITKKQMLLLTLTCTVTLIYLCWYFLGLPTLLAKITGLFLGTERRSILFTAFLNLIFMTIFQEMKFHQKIEKGEKVVFLIWSFFLIATAVVYTPLKSGVIAGAIAMTCFYVWALRYLLMGNFLRFSQVWASAMFLSTFAFNPIVFNGYDQLFVESKLAKKILTSDDQKKETWIVTNHIVLPAMPRILGLHSFGGPTFYPQKDFWQIVDPQNKYINIWNRYANIRFRIDNIAEMNIRLVEFDSIEIILPSNSELFDKLKITRILSFKDKSPQVIPKDFVQIEETSCCIIWHKNNATSP